MNRRQLEMAIADLAKKAVDAGEQQTANCLYALAAAINVGSVEQYHALVMPWYTELSERMSRD